MKKVFTLLFAGISLSASAQQNFKPAQLVLQSGDSLTGEINYRNWEKNPAAVEFRRQAESPRVYTLNEIRSFTITGFDRYEHAVVQRTTRPLDPQVLYQANYSDTTLTDTALLRTLVLGDVSLYELVRDRPFYYIRRQDGTLEELRYRIQLQEGTDNFYTQHIYRDQLLSRLGLDPESAEGRKLKYLPYKEQALTRFVENINARNMGTANAWTTEKPATIRFFAGAGLLFYSLDKNSGSDRVGKISFEENSTSPVFQAGIDIYALRNLQRVAARLELGYSSMEFHGQGEQDYILDVVETNRYDIRMRNITPSLTLLYSFVKSNRTDLFGGFGMGMNISSYQENKLVSSYSDGSPDREREALEFEKSWTTLNAKLGFRLADHYEFNLNYKIGGSFSRHSFLGISPNMLTLQLNYRL